MCSRRIIGILATISVLLHAAGALRHSALATSTSASLTWQRRTPSCAGPCNLPRRRPNGWGAGSQRPVPRPYARRRRILCDLRRSCVCSRADRTSRRRRTMRSNGCQLRLPDRGGKLRLACASPACPRSRRVQHDRASVGHPGHIGNRMHSNQAGGALYTWLSPYYSEHDRPAGFGCVELRRA
jgi:hypothetical protein